MVPALLARPGTGGVKTVWFIRVTPKRGVTKNVGPKTIVSLTTTFRFRSLRTFGSAGKVGAARADRHVGITRVKAMLRSELMIYASVTDLSLYG